VFAAGALAVRAALILWPVACLYRGKRALAEVSQLRGGSRAGTTQHICSRRPVCEAQHTCTSNHYRYLLTYLLDTGELRHYGP